MFENQYGMYWRLYCMLRMGICDDDERFANELEGYIIEYGLKKGLSFDTRVYLNAKELFADLEEEGLFDILFLDIELNQDTGIEIGKKLRSDLKNETMQIIFVSSKEGYALQLFDIRPMNFLIKPICYEMVAHVLDEYDRLFHFGNRFFQYNIGKREYSINENMILYFQSQGRKIHIVTQDESIEFYGKLSDVITQLNDKSFCMVHKSYVVNMKYVEQYTSDKVFLVNGEEIPISESQRSQVRKKLLTNII